MSLQIKKATRSKKKIRFAVSGVAGSGKTYSTLKMATELIKLLFPGEEPRILLGDTEHESSTCYADGNPFDFDIVPLEPPFHPEKLIEFLKLSRDYHVAIVDSMSHFHIGDGGILDLHDQATRRCKGNSFVAWKEITPIYNKMVDAIIRCPAHLFGTLRAKSEYVQSENNGKKTVEKVGMSTQMRDGFEFEFDHHGRIELSNSMTMEKTRCSELNGRFFSRPGKEVAEILARWSTTGADAPQQAPSDDRHSRTLARLRELFGKVFAGDVKAFSETFGVEAKDLPTMSVEELEPIGRGLAAILEKRQADDQKPEPLFKDANPEKYDAMRAKFFKVASEIWGAEDKGAKAYDWLAEQNLLPAHPTKSRPSISRSTEKQLSAAIKALEIHQTKLASLAGPKN